MPSIVPVQFTPPRGWDQLKAVYGDFKFTEQSGGNVLIQGSWAHDNLVVEHNVCGTGLSIQLHKKVVPIFEACLAEAIKRCPTYKIRQLGGFCARHQLHNPKNPLSIHSWGAAFDLNWDANPLGVVKWDYPPELIAAFTEQGWEHGAHFRVPDAMHFQYATGI